MIVLLVNEMLKRSCLLENGRYLQVHTVLLTHKWHELLVLTTSTYQAIHGGASSSRQSTVDAIGGEHDFMHQVSANLVNLQTCLTAMMGRTLTMDQLR